MVEHTQGDVSGVSQSTAEGQCYFVHGVQSGFCCVLGVGVLQEFPVTGLTPPPGPHPTVTEDKEASNDMNPKEDVGGSPFLPGSLEAFGSTGPSPKFPGPQSPGTSGGNKGLHSQSPRRIGHPGRCHWAPGGGFSSGNLRVKEGTPVHQTWVQWHEQHVALCL